MKNVPGTVSLRLAFLHDALYPKTVPDIFPLIPNALGQLIDFGIGEVLAGLEQHVFEVLIAFGAAGVADVAERAVAVDEYVPDASKMAWKGIPN